MNEFNCIQASTRKYLNLQVYKPIMVIENLQANIKNERNNRNKIICRVWTIPDKSTSCTDTTVHYQDLGQSRSSVTEDLRNLRHPSHEKSALRAVDSRQK